MLIYEQFPGIKRVPDKEVGIEVEIEGKGINPNENPPLWKGTHDGSLRGEAIEYVLRGPVTRDRTSEALKNLKMFLKASNTTILDSDRCGVHIHVNVQDLTVEQCLNFILIYLVFEDVLVKYCGESREGNLFCLRSQDAELILYSLQLCKRYSDMQYLQSDNFRYASINVSALQKYGTLEFRSLKTPLDVMTIQEWIEILLCLKDYALNVKDSRDIVESFSKNGEEAFLREIFKDHAKALKFRTTPQMMRDGVRRVQDIAYIKSIEKPVVKPLKKNAGGFVVAEIDWNNRVAPLGLDDPRELGVMQAERAVRARVPRPVQVRGVDPFGDEPPAQPVIMDDGWGDGPEPEEPDEDF